MQIAGLLQSPQTARTPMAFLSCFISQGIFFPEDRCKFSAQWNKDSVSRKFYLEQCVVHAATKCVIDIRFKGLQCSSIAAAIVFHVRRCHGIEPLWNDQLSSICLHDPFSSKQVQKVLALFDTTPPALDSDEQQHCGVDDLAAHFAATDLQATTTTRPVSAESIQVFVTPDHNNKENSKPPKDISPVAISSMEFLS